MVKKRLMAKGIITRMESRIKNKENCQFKSRVLVQNFLCCQKKYRTNYERLNYSRSRKDVKCLKHEQEKHHTALSETPRKHDTRNCSMKICRIFQGKP